MSRTVSPDTRLFVFGLGYTAGALARAVAGDAAWVGGTVRAVDRAIAIAAEGIRTFVFDGENAGIGVAAAVRHATHLLISVPPRAADPVLTHHRAAVLAAPDLKWIGHLSTVGVYGDHAGAWVSEETPAKPAPGRSTARLEAEEAWAAIAAERGVPLAVFRLAGIYGPGRNPFVSLAEGRARRIVKPGQVFNRIHRDDIVEALLAALGRNVAGVFNVTDNEPAPPQDLVAYAAELMSAPVPPDTPFAEAELSPMAHSFYGQNKRVRNKRLKETLGLELRYPTYREGLSALWRDGTWK